VLNLLLDEHISPAVAAGLRRRAPQAVVHTLVEWRGGDLIGQDDEVCLTAAADEGLAFVTYDRRTFPNLLKSWAEQGRHHGGVIFVDGKTILPSDIGGLIRALNELAQTARDWDWTDRVCFLRYA
jgi:Domain of unknown function (DUF5615)